MRVCKVGSITYSVKDQWNSKRVRLRVTPERGVEVTRPKRFPLKEIDKFVLSKRTWIEEAMQGYENSGRIWRLTRWSCTRSDRNGQ